MPLSETTLLKVAGDLVYARGEDYVRYVRGLRTTDFKAYASIQAKNVYQVELDWSGPLPDGSCTCPHHADGNFCKHLVATGLAAIDTGRVAVDDTASGTAEAALEAAVQAMDVDELRELVMTLAQRDDGVRRLLEIRATTASGDDAHAKAELEAYVRNTLTFRGFVDYRRSFEVAEVASEMLDELENHLNSGAAEIVRPALLRAVTRLRKILEQVDDSSGSIGDECQRAADLYARACRLGEPDPVKLATWLVKFRADSPGWPHAGLGGLRGRVRREGTRDLPPGGGGAGPQARRSGSLEAVRSRRHAAGARRSRRRRRPGRPLAQLSGNTRSTGRSSTGCAQPAAPRRRWHGSIVQSPRDESPATVVATNYWLSPDDVAETYQGLGRIDDAVAVLRADFVRQPSVGTYRVLLDFAAGVDRADTERTWAFDHARQLAASDRFAAGAVLVQLSLSEGDVDAAWQAADRYGPGWAWRELADRGAEARPVDSCRPVPAAAREGSAASQLQALSRHRRDTGDDGQTL